VLRPQLPSTGEPPLRADSVVRKFLTPSEGAVGVRFARVLVAGAWVVRGRRHYLWHRRCLLDQLVSDYLEGLDVLLRARENDGALCACDEEGHEAVRSGTENADLLVEFDEVPLRGAEDLPGTVQQWTG
jgi:hypothetical protein